MGNENPFCLRCDTPMEEGKHQWVCPVCDQRLDTVELECAVCHGSGYEWMYENPDGPNYKKCRCQTPLDLEVAMAEMRTLQSILKMAAEYETTMLSRKIPCGHRFSDLVWDVETGDAKCARCERGEQPDTDA